MPTFSEIFSSDGDASYGNQPDSTPPAQEQEFQSADASQSDDGSGSMMDGTSDDAALA